MRGCTWALMGCASWFVLGFMAICIWLVGARVEQIVEHIR